MDLYKEEIIEHYRNPRNQKSLTNANAKAHVANPLCGDSMDMELVIDKKNGNNTIKEISFKSEGCAISTASASMLTEKVRGASIDEVKELGKDNVLGLLGIDLMPNRLKCALLSLEVLQKAVLDWKEKNNVMSS